MKVVEMFNHKGGVSKTTSTFHVAWMLTKLGKRVLIVDGDPQCNMTSLFLGDMFEDYYDNDATKRQNIKDGVSAAFEGKPNPIEAIECLSHPKNNMLYLIPGHMDLAEYESPLSLALLGSSSIVTLQNLPGAIYCLIERCAEQYNIDYTFIDMNPGLTALNQIFFMYADGFIAPVNPDPFSIMSLRTLSKTLPRWEKWYKANVESFQSAAYPLPEKTPGFIGEIIQRFNVRNKKPAKAYEDKISEIKDYIEQEFCTAMASESMLFDISNLISRGILQDHCLGEVPDYGSLIQRANEAMLPVFDLDQEAMQTQGLVYTRMDENREKFSKLYRKIGEVIIELLEV